MAFAALVWVVAAAVSVFFAARMWWFPEAISAHGADYDRQFAATWWVAGVIFVLAQLLLGWVMLRYRGMGRRAVYSHGNNALEMTWTLGGAVLFLGLVLIGTRIWAGVHLAAPRAGALEVEVSAKQFAWSYRYKGPDNRFGRTRPELANDSAGNPFGLDESDEAARDDVVTAMLRVPAGRPVVLMLTAKDVIHNFFVRELRIKQDTVPGMRIPLSFQAEKPGRYEVACSELCGLGHHQMRSTLLVMPAEEFDAWMREQAGP
ncbi:MAG: cytochrome c oxidase subunit II [Bryobacterales bacterium]|jgi:cytochrome c oxidase subunit II|nr:cytochrome c oxidase subunit II [Bryobacterales bacterium]